MFLVAVAVVGVLLLFVLPGRTLLGQRHTLSITESRIHALSSENQKLSDRINQLQNNSEIERIARQDYGLVKPGEQALAILPPVAPPSTVATTSPKAAHPGHHQSFWQSLEFWR
ncbi:MAG: septum formation initiator family protein [Actinomycetota bacterium]|nr:septum formation initiator family protein [Actinomycetota bacterium]